MRETINSFTESSNMANLVTKQVAFDKILVTIDQNGILTPLNQQSLSRVCLKNELTIQSKFSLSLIMKIERAVGEGLA